jgi:hypothetical protein
MQSIELIHEYARVIHAGDGPYLARAYATRQAGGLWEGFFAFLPLWRGRPLVTDRETTQSKRGDVVYWANGIRPIYLQGALRRAQERLGAASRLRQRGPRLRDLRCPQGCTFRCQPRHARHARTILIACPYQRDTACPLSAV